MYRIADPVGVRVWAQDALENSDDGSAPTAGHTVDDETTRRVGEAILDFLRSHPTGNGAEFRAWVDAEDPFDRGGPGVEVLTFHGAKGREWHTVHLIGCETSLVPHRSATTIAARAEEARLLYVATTRATDVLVVNWARRRGGYQRRSTPFLDGYESTTPEPAPPPAELLRVERVDAPLDRLKAWRDETARHRNLLPDELCNDTVLALIARARPATADDLAAATGWGAITSRSLAPGILDALGASSSA